MRSAKDAGLTGRELASRIGCHFTKISRIENGNQAPSEENIKAWCRTCHAEDQILDLIVTSRAIESMYIEWRRQTRAGMKRLLLSSVPLYRGTTIRRPGHRSGPEHDGDHTAGRGRRPRVTAVGNGRKEDR